MQEIKITLSGKSIWFSVFFLITFWHSLAASEDELMKTAIIQLEFKDQDSLKFVTARVNEFVSDSIGMSIGEVDLYFYVERTFSLLPIGDRFNMTDENGEVTIEFPNDLPGDSEGNLRVIAKLEDAEEYADTQTSRIIDWGVPAALDEGDEERSLWAAGANAPISLLIITNTLIAIAWGIIIYIFYKIYQISKI